MEMTINAMGEVATPNGTTDVWKLKHEMDRLVDPNSKTQRDFCNWLDRSFHGARITERSRLNGNKHPRIEIMVYPNGLVSDGNTAISVQGFKEFIQSWTDTFQSDRDLSCNMVDKCYQTAIQTQKPQILN